MNIEQIFTKNQEWAQNKLNVEPNYFKNLSKGQSPGILYIGCSDSRVTAEEMMGISPGEAFIHRNIANLVPNTDLNVISVINYAVEHLEVDHIIVCGHYYCGGVKAAMQPNCLGMLNPWLREIRDVYRLHQDSLSKIEDDEARYKKLVELNVQEQCINLIKKPSVQKAWRERNITVHGWVFDIHSGKLIDLKIDLPKILENIMDIYHLD